MALPVCGQEWTPVHIPADHLNFSFGEGLFRAWLARQFCWQNWFPVVKALRAGVMGLLVASTVRPILATRTVHSQAGKGALHVSHVWDLRLPPLLAAGERAALTGCALGRAPAASPSPGH